MGFPPTESLNRLSAPDFADVVAPLFEGAPRFLRLLADARPFTTDADLMGMAREVARSMPRADQVALLDAHPQIGADPASLSTASYAEQGHGSAAASDDTWVAEELAMLNEAYERRFGFRFVVFVAGRPRAAMVPLMEVALRNDREAELARGIDDVIDIAADRLGLLRSQVLEGVKET